MHLMGSSCKKPGRGLWTSGPLSLLGHGYDQATWAFARV
jgi:hypothetical protein